MSTGPTFYYPTTDQPYTRSLAAIKYYYDNAGNTVYEVGIDKQLSFWLQSSNTYTAPFAPNSGGLFGSFLNSGNRRGITLSDPAYTTIEIFKQFPKGKRGIQPFLFNTTTLWQFADDASYIPGNNLGMYDSNGVASVRPNSYYGFWPDAGISFTNQWANLVFQSMAQEGATVDYLLIDNEMVITSNDDPTKGPLTNAITTAIAGATLFNQPWRGLSSWLEYYLLEGGQTSYDFSNTPQGFINASAWNAAWNRFQNKAMNDAFVSALTTYNPEGVASDYMEYVYPYTPGYTGLYILGEYGNPQAITHRLPAGNGTSPVLYGWFSVAAVADQVNFIEKTPTVYYYDPTKIMRYGTSYTDSVFDKYFTRGPWSSFISCVSEMRQAKWERPHLPVTPWIPSPWQVGQYNFGIGTIYKRDNKDSTYPWGKNQGVNQMPVEIGHNRWRFRLIDSETGGFTGPTGLTNGIRILLTGETEQNLLSWVYNGITSGVTYVFSYYVNTSLGNTNFNFGLNNYRNTHYNKPTGITFYQTLPAATGPFYSFTTGGIYYPPGTSNWTQVQYEFSVPSDDPLNPTFNPTLEVTVFENSIETTTEPGGMTLAGMTLFIANPIFEIKGSTTNTSVIDITSILSEDNQIIGTDSPPCGFAVCEPGYNSRQAVYNTGVRGNTAYFYELVRHCCLLGTKAFGWFNAFSFIDNSYPGARAYGFNQQKALETGKQVIALTKGFSGFIEEYKLINETLHDVHQKIKGFTLTTAGLDERWNWSLPYHASAAPDARGQTWWWRITVQNGYTLYVNGMTLPTANGEVGLWLGTTGPTLAGVNISSSGPILPKEPTGITAIREFNFYQMNSLADLTGNSLSFSRGSSASFIGASGFLVTVGSGQPRFHYDPETLTPRGILLEPSVANQLNWSESFASTGGSQNNWIDTNLTRITGNTSPSNDLSAIRFTATGANATLLSTNAVGNTTDDKVLSIWLKGITGNESVQYTVDGGTSWNNIPNIKNSWNRFAFGPIFNGVCFFGHHVGFRLGNTNDSVMIWGAQLENFIYDISGNGLMGPSGKIDPTYWVPLVSSYIRTLGTTVTRSADSLTFPTASSWLGNTYGTIIFETENINFNIGSWFSLNTPGGICGGGAITLGPNSSGFRFDLNERRFGPNIQYVHVVGNCLTTRVAGPNTPYKYCWGWSPIGFKFASNSFIRTIPYSLGWGNPTSFTPPFCTIKSIRSFDRVFEDSILRQFAMGGVTQIGWLNNGDGELKPVTYYT
jgi:hypothetical protein